MPFWDRLHEPLYNDVSSLDIIQFFVSSILLYLFARWLRRFMSKRLGKLPHVEPGTAYAIARLTFYVIMAVGMFMLTGLLGISDAKLLTFAGALGVGIGLGLQGVARNFFSGIILLLGRLVRAGDRIEAADFTGDVRTIGLNSTIIRTPDEADIIVPNSLLIEQPVKNWTLHDRRRLVSTEVSVSYDADPERVREALIRAAQSVDSILHSEEPLVRFAAFGASTLNFRVSVYTTDFVTIPNKIISDLNFAIAKVFKEEQIDIPLPQSVVRWKQDPPPPEDSAAQSQTPTTTPKEKTPPEKQLE
ncbi:MAG: mechanosensitive ion channel [Armatimonadetes bacterium]|nr:mechanosensitive ion channel [Armatimonadota bacterium]